MEIPQIDLWSDAQHEPIDLARSIALQRQHIETPFYVIDLDDISFKVRLWCEVLPRVAPHYAVKCNSDKVIVKFFVDAGLGFDCATKKEMELVLSLGADASRIIYAHTIKCPSHLRWAREKGVTRVTFDNISELEKVKKNFPEALLILRLQVVEGDLHNTTDKFGCPIDEIPALLEATRELHLNFFGFSFHVGWRNEDCSTYVKALRLCKKAEKVAVSLGFNPKYIDIGGGFDCYRGNESSFRKTADSIRKETEMLFPSTEGYEIISEPGTFFVGSAFSLCAKIAGKRDNKGLTQLYVNDSVYVSFSLIKYGDDYLQIQPLESSGVFVKDSQGEDLNPTRIFGLTCSGFDVIIQLRQLPEMEIGDWILFYNQGAYTASIETDFNMLERPDRYYRSGSKTVIEASRCLCTGSVSCISSNLGILS